MPGKNSRVDGCASALAGVQGGGSSCPIRFAGLCLNYAQRCLRAGGRTEVLLVYLRQHEGQKHSILPASVRHNHAPLKIIGHTGGRSRASKNLPLSISLSTKEMGWSAARNLTIITLLKESLTDSFFLSECIYKFLQPLMKTMMAVSGHRLAMAGFTLGNDVNHWSCAQIFN